MSDEGKKDSESVKLLAGSEQLHGSQLLINEEVQDKETTVKLEENFYI